MLTALEYASRATTGALAEYIGIPAHSSITGNGYCVGTFDDGTVLRVGSFVYRTDDTGMDAADWLSRIGNRIANIPQAERARQLAECYSPIADEYIVGRSRWSLDGSFLGLA